MLQTKRQERTPFKVCDSQCGRYGCFGEPLATFLSDNVVSKVHKGGPFAKLLIYNVAETSANKPPLKYMSDNVESVAHRETPCKYVADNVIATAQRGISCKKKFIKCNSYGL